METLNERKIVEKLRVITTKLPISHLLCVLVYHHWYQINTRLNTFTLWSDRKHFQLEYLRVLMKTLEMNEKSQKNQGSVLTKLLIS